MASPKKEVKNELIKHLCSNSCEKFKSLLDDMRQAYINYSNFFPAPGKKIFTYLKLPTECLLNTSKCIGGEIKVYIHVSVKIDRSYGDGDKLLYECKEVYFPDVLVVSLRSKSVSKIFSILKTLTNRNEITWCPDIVADADKLDNPLNSVGENCYRVKLSDINIQTIGAVYVSTFQQATTTAPLEVLAEVRLFEEKGYGKRFVEAEGRIVESLKSLKGIPVTVFLNLIPCPF